MKFLNKKSAIRNPQSKGRILRVKFGYNPNSSSIGSIVFALKTTLLGITAGFGIVAGIIFSLVVKRKPEKAQQDKEAEKPEEERKSDPVSSEESTP